MNAIQEMIDRKNTYMLPQTEGVMKNDVILLVNCALTYKKMRGKLCFVLRDRSYTLLHDIKLQSLSLLE